MAKRVETMKSDATVKRELRRLRAFIESEPLTSLEGSIAYTIEHAIRWAREPGIKGWPSPLEEAKRSADRMRKEQVRAPVQMPPKLNSNVSETRLSRSGCFQSTRRTRKPC